jgi:hypothetical protein
MKNNKAPTPDVWNESTQDSLLEDVAEIAATTSKPLFKPQVPETDSAYDMEGLMTDFPTATELQKFVYDVTGIALNLKGRANKLKYQIAMDVLNGATVDAAFVSTENPYLDKNDLVPTEELRVLPPRDATLPDRSEVQNLFHTAGVPHPDPEMRAGGERVSVCFRKYLNGIITYEIEGPLCQKEMGQKIDKYGRNRPEYIKWIDPRTPELLIVRADGTTTPTGQKLRALLKSQPVNKTTVWDTWVDRDFAYLQQEALDNPWGAE